MKKNQLFTIICSGMLTGIGVLLMNNNNVEKYSDKWFTSVPRKELENEREKFNTMRCSAGEDFSLAVRLQNIVQLFDNELRRRDWGDSSLKDYKYPPHREHGRNLYKKND